MNKETKKKTRKRNQLNRTDVLGYIRKKGLLNNGGGKRHVYP